MAASPATQPTGSVTSRLTSLRASLPSASLTSQVTDDAGLLTSTASDAVASLAERGVNLWVVTYSDASEAATDFAERAWQATGLGTSDLLLVINVADGARSYAFDGSARDSVWSASKRDDVRAKVKEHLSDGDWDGAVTAVADAGASGDSSEWGSRDSGAAAASSESASSENAVALGMLGLVLAGGAGYLVFRRRLRDRDGARGGARGDAGKGGEDLPLPELAARAGTVLVEVDDAVRTAEEELAFAEAEFGAGGAEDLRHALEAARADLEAAFAQRRLLDDDVPDTPAQQRQMYQEILTRAAHARQVLEAPLADLATRRQNETNLPAEHARTDELITTAREQLAAARQVLPTLQQVFPAERVARLEPLPEQAEALLQAAETALTQSRQAYNTMGSRAAALEQLRLAQHALAQVRSLTDQVMHARERWQAEDREAAEREAQQRASAAQATAQLPTRLARLGGQVAEVDSYLATHRGAIGPGTRMALSEARRLHQEAVAQAGSDPAGAMEKVEQAEALVAQAQASAEAEVRLRREELPSRSTGGGLDMGSLLLGGLLFGNFGGHHDHWDDHPGSWGGGGFGGGGFGGGGGGGGFGGGGGSF